MKIGKSIYVLVLPNELKYSWFEGLDWSTPSVSKTISNILTNNLLNSYPGVAENVISEILKTPLVASNYELPSKNG